MPDHRPFWKRPLGMTLMISITVALGVWLAMGRPIPEGWLDESGRPQIELPEMPELFQAEEDDRIFCAESIDTGQCSCIRSNGERPQIGDEECRERARSSATVTEDGDAG
ncbi:MAG: hypothetical protein AAGJ52_05640 [Pseudomonadota bacterium]